MKNIDKKQSNALRITVKYILISVVYIALVSFLMHFVFETVEMHYWLPPIIWLFYFALTSVFLFKLIRSYDEKAKVFEESILKEKLKSEESDMLKSFFLSNISHEIRTPLNNILGFSELLLEGGCDEEEKDEYLRFLNENVNRLISVTEKIIFTSELQLGDVAVKKEYFNLKEFLIEQQNILSQRIKEANKNIEITYNGITDLKIFSDKVLLVRLLKPLLENAVKFTNKGFIEVRTNINVDDLLEVHVIDSGIGISKDKQSSLFKPFRQIDGSSTREIQGLGLGLHLSASIVYLLGGTSKVTSVEGVGSDFYFSIPYKKNATITNI